MEKTSIRKFCVAPMMGYTTPYARKLYRILSKKTFLFTEMIACKSMVYSKNKDLIIENNNHNPVALQIGGSDFEDLKKCSRIAYDYNYDEINLNVGCPSKNVQKGRFGACLMQDKTLVRQCLESLQNNKIKTTLKCRIGLGKELNYEFFEEFIDEVLKSGISVIYVHARNAILNGISPKLNRSIPPLNYEFVKRIKRKFPDTEFILNGGIDNIQKAKQLSKEFDGVMVGRLIQNNPFILKEVDHLFYNIQSKTRINDQVINDYFNYIRPKTELDSIYRLLSPLLQIFFGIPNSKNFKIQIHEYMRERKINLIEKILLNFVKENNLVLN
tara:strand:- start:625 stop:1608 length:984 start_codon:yes stop_codon:yes gene_type:complete